MTNGQQPPRRRIIRVALVIAAAAVLSTVTLLAVQWAAGPRAAARRNTDGLGFVRLDRPARAVALPSLAGSGTIDVTRSARKPLVLNFWSSTCGPCKKETPALVSVARAMGSKVAFLGIDTADQRGSARAFIARYKVPYPVAFDPDASAADRYGVPGLPVTFFLSPSGKTILGENVGALTPGKLRTILHRLYGVT
jgi:cytochrome c biogenesis protein CcmG, thiol:disulfide interchange protein DsbE